MEVAAHAAAAIRNRDAARQPGRPHRSAAESRRPRALRAVVHPHARRASRSESRRLRAQRAVAGRALQSLPHRHEPRLGLVVAARDAARASPSTASGIRRSSSTSTRWATSRRTSSRRTRKPVNANLPKDVETWLEIFGRANADAFTKTRLAVLRRRRVRPLLSRLRRLLAGAARRHRHDVRGGRQRPRRHRPSRATTARSTRWPTASPATTPRPWPRCARRRRIAKELLQYTYEMMRKQVDVGTEHLPASPRLAELPRR